MYFIIQNKATSISKNGRNPLISKLIPSLHPKVPIILFLLLIITILASREFIEQTPNGAPDLSKDRKEKLAKELKVLDEAEQYVLIARSDGLYPCYSCIGQSTIFLRRGEIYKYGFTTKNMAGRYGNTLKKLNLLYIIQYIGTITECMKEEKRKIYYYAILPENLNREIPLIRPPGNKQDN